MRTNEAAWRQRLAAERNFWLLTGSGLGLAVVGVSVLASGVHLCWPRWLAARGCLSLFAAGLLCWLLGTVGLAAIAWQWLRTARSLARLLRLPQPPPEPRLDRLAAAMGLAGALTLVADERPWAITYGFWRPRIAISTGLCHRLAE